MWEKPLSSDTESREDDTESVINKVKEIGDRSTNKKEIDTKAELDEIFSFLNEGKTYRYKDVYNRLDIFSTLLNTKDKEIYDIFSNEDTLKLISGLDINNLTNTEQQQKNFTLLIETYSEVYKELLNSPETKTAITNLFPDKKLPFEYYGELPIKNLESTIYDKIAHHNQDIDFAKKQNISWATLLHYDTHSDIFNTTSSPDTESIADYINTLLSNGNVNEVYRIMWDWGKSRDDTNKEILQEEKDASQTVIIDKYFSNAEPWDYVLYSNKISGTLTVNIPTDEDKEKWKPIKFHKIYESELPNLEDNKNIWLDVDFDVFSNTWYDTNYRKGNNPSLSELNTTLSNFWKNLIEKNIYPKYATFCKSPLYTDTRDISQIWSYFNIITNPKNEINTDDFYSHGRFQHIDLDLLYWIEENVFSKNWKSFDYDIYQRLWIRSMPEIAQLYKQNYDEIDVNKKNIIKEDLQTAIEKRKKAFERQKYGLD